MTSAGENGTRQALEAQLENADQGTYHGDPMPDDDPLRPVVFDRWQSAETRSGS